MPHQGLYIRIGPKKQVKQGSLDDLTEDFLVEVKRLLFEAQEESSKGADFER